MADLKKVWSKPGEWKQLQERSFEGGKANLLRALRGGGEAPVPSGLETSEDMQYHPQGAGPIPAGLHLPGTPDGDWMSDEVAKTQAANLADPALATKLEAMRQLRQKWVDKQRTGLQQALPVQSEPFGQRKFPALEE